MRRILGAVAVTCLAAASPAFATNGMRMIGFGPVQNSMGGVSIAVPLDAATVATNPAGLLSIGKRVDVGGTYFAPKVEYKATGAVMSSNTIESDRAASYIPTLAASWSLGDDLAAGVGVFGTAGMGVEDPANLFGSITETSYMQARLAPGVAYRVMPGLVVGATLNAMYALMSYEVASAAPPAGPAMQPRDDGAAFGIGATLGVLYTPVEMISIGAAYETKSSFQDFEFEIPAHTSFMTGAPVNVPGGTEKLAFDQPPVASVGVAVRPVEGLVLALDGEYIFWSDTNGQNQPRFTSDPQLTGAMPFNLSWDDQVVVKVGGEYAVARDVKVRLGYNYGKSPLRAERGFENIAFPAVAEHHITGGVGMTFGQTVVNASVGYSPESKISGSAPTQGIGSYEAKMSQLSFDLGLAYRF